MLPRDSGSQCSLLLISLINLVQTATALMERGFKTENNFKISTACTWVASRIRSCMCVRFVSGAMAETVE